MAPHLDPDAVLVSLQNGVGNVERIHAATSRRVVAGLVYIGTNMPAPAHVRHSGGDRIVLGAVKGCGADEALVGETAAIFRKAGINADVSADIEAGLWHKLMLNCAYNAICALTGKPYGEMGAVPEVRAVMQEAAQEVIALARRKGAAIPADVFDGLFTMTQSMPQQMSSTAQDIAKGRADRDRLSQRLRGARKRGARPRRAGQPHAQRAGEVAGAARRCRSPTRGRPEKPNAPAGPG